MEENLQDINFKQNQVLLVDDEDYILTLLSRILSNHVGKIFTAKNGSEALEILAREEIDAAILDIKMPGMTGIELLEEIKKIYPDVQCIMLTGHGDKEHVIQALRNGAFDFLDKPATKEIVVNRVRRALEVRNLKKNHDEVTREILKLYPDEVKFEDFVKKPLTAQATVLKALASIIRMKMINLENTRHMKSAG